jgi:hypothetical protein
VLLLPRSCERRYRGESPARCRSAGALDRRLPVRRYDMVFPSLLRGYVCAWPKRHGCGREEAVLGHAKTKEIWPHWWVHGLHGQRVMCYSICRIRCIRTVLRRKMLFHFSSKICFRFMEFCFCFLYIIFVFNSCTSWVTVGIVIGVNNYDLCLNRTSVISYSMGDIAPLWPTPSVRKYKMF